MERVFHDKTQNVCRIIDCHSRHTHPHTILYIFTLYGTCAHSPDRRHSPKVGRAKGRTAYVIEFKHFELQSARLGRPKPRCIYILFTHPTKQTVCGRLKSLAFDSCVCVLYVFSCTSIIAQQSAYILLLVHFIQRNNKYQRTRSSCALSPVPQTIYSYS